MMSYYRVKRLFAFMENNKTLEDIIKNDYYRSYAHFDVRVKLSEVYDYISNPQKVATHSFYPFILDSRPKLKVHTEKQPHDGRFEKTYRPICYAAHLDRCIYQYYAYKLNETYNNYVENTLVDKCSKAYRTNLHGKTNIDFAKEVFDFIKSTEKCVIIVGDFKSFFDNLDHKYLKERLKQLLNVTSLSADMYAVYKNITGYSKWDIEDIFNIRKGENSKLTENEIRHDRIILSHSQFKNNVGRCAVHNKKLGIPQGSSISAVLANIYMIEFDSRLSSFIEEINGKYLRYCDDFIIIVPYLEEGILKKTYDKLMEEVAKAKLILQSDKTQLYTYENQSISPLQNVVDGIETKSRILNYLGFSFDGKKVSLRDKTITKYYNKLYRKIKTIIKQNFVSKYGNPISCNNLYTIYSKNGSIPNQENKWGNFITYVNKCERIFGKDENVNLVKRRHMQKIRKRLKQ